MEEERRIGTMRHKGDEARRTEVCDSDNMGAWRPVWREGGRQDDDGDEEGPSRRVNIFRAIFEPFYVRCF